MIGKIRNGLYLKRVALRKARIAILASLLAGVVMAYGVDWRGHLRMRDARASATAEITATPFHGSFAAIAEKLSPSVVNIRVTRVQKTELPSDLLPGGPFRDRFHHFFDDRELTPRRQPATGAGSGVIVSGDGLILTNNHVVEESREVTVTLADQRELKAEIVGRDPGTDLAVLRVRDAGGLPAAQLGDSDALQVGDWVLALGNPFGLSHTLTSGIVSAKGRVIGAGPYDDFIQTDASINPGNSGGPLFNMRGEVVGINTAIIPHGQGIGFAVPVNLAKQLVPQLVEHGEVTRGYIGVNIQAVTGDLARALKLQKPEGALVSDVVSGGPADKAGVEQGDVIISLNGKAVQSSQQLPSIVASTPVGDDVSMKIIRSGKERELQVKVGKLPSRNQGADPTDDSAPSRWGMELQDLTPEMARRRGTEQRGVLVVNVEPGSPADQASVRRGDIIVEVNRQAVHSVESLKGVMTDAAAQDTLLLLVERDRARLFVALSS
ncbi:MAG: DegQ family serine endoprotease [Syntrophobacteraceae bacterium]|jgi:serine protease Do|nr:DegQ family serine endoprotease [Syntrophobacteraceae bacterium]MCU0588986.1 DegQ family serine endoprotease [Syntrophobacteraceae bacterium]